MPFRARVSFWLPPFVTCSRLSHLLVDRLRQLGSRLQLANRDFVHSSRGQMYGIEIYSKVQ